MSRKSKQHAPRVPIGVAGGIRAQAGRGRPARHWWGQRWIAALEGRMLGARLGRGRSYAASGQVAELRIAPGGVTAVVQGASPQPYRVDLRLHMLTAAGRRHVLAALHARPLLAARLLVRELPAEMEALFKAAGCPLFPVQKEDLKSDCTCPDWANPCKHAAAVALLLAEAIDRDPLLLLTLRGLDRAALTGASGDSATRKETTVTEDVAEPAGEAPAGSAALDAAPAAFWGAGVPAAETDFGPAPACADAAPLVRRLGPLPFWRGEERFLDAMHTVYARAAPRGWTVWNGERLDLRPPAEETAPAARFHLRHRRLNMDLTMR